MKRNRIIETAGTLFETYGIKAVSIDDIASRLSISKKTVYENFRDKGELVFECVRESVMQGMKAIEEARERAESPLEQILFINMITLRQSINRCPSYFRDLEAYPEAKLQEFDKLVSLVGSKYVRLFFECIDKGLLLPETDMNMILDFFVEQIRLTVEKYHSGQTQSPAAHFNIVKTFLTGICTEKGRNELAKLKSEKFLN